RPYSALSVQDARLYHPTFRLNRRGEWLPTICRLGRSNGSNVIGRIGTVVSGSDAGLRHEPTKAGRLLIRMATRAAEICRFWPTQLDYNAFCRARGIAPAWS